MCGINGLITRDNDLKNKIPLLNKLIRHRGPDDEGFLLVNSSTGSFQQCSGDDSINEIKQKHPHFKNVNQENYDVILAQRRLSIIDLSENGHCPMSTADGKIWITYNGEIYNYIELREELKSAGFTFRTNSDTEVILNSYLKWGVDCLNKFNGMWGFAIWDSRTKELILARDRFGIKPVYFANNESYFAFSSEIKPLTALMKSAPEIVGEKIPFFILYGNRLNSTETYIKDINSLQASHFLIFKNGSLTIKKYYEIPVINKEKQSEERLKTEIIELLSSSITLRFRSDVPVGTCLSGGFDSSSIVSLSDRLNQKSLQTFSAVWDEADCDESKYIDIVNNRFNCTAQKVIPKAEDFEKVFSQMSYFQEIPTEGPGLYPQWYVMRKAAGNVKVLLDGQGGDEVFGGYFLMGAYLRGMIRDKKIFKIFSEFKHFVEFLNKNGIHSFSSWLFPRQYTRLARKKQTEAASILKRSVINSLKPAELLIDIEPPKKFKNYINNLSYHFIRNFTIPTLLHYEDRSSMAHSIESRVPFLDYRLVEFGMNLPTEHLTHKGVSRPLFRKALTPFLPSEVTERKDKLGYPVPFAKWTRTSLKEYICSALLNQNSMIYDYVDKEIVQRNLESHFAETRDYSWEIWRLLSLENFLHLYRNLNFLKN